MTKEEVLKTRAEIYMAEELFAKNEKEKVIWRSMVGMGECPRCGNFLHRYNLPSQYCCKCGQHVTFEGVTRNGD